MFLTLNLRRCIAVVSAVALAVILTITTISCSLQRDVDIHTRIYRKYSNVRSFSAEIEVTVTVERTTNTYQMRQYYKSDMFREDILSPENLAGTTYIFAGGTMLVIPPDNNDDIQFKDIPETRNYTFLPEFFSRYFNAEAEVSSINTELTDIAEDDNVTVLEIQLDGNNIYRASQKLWIDNQTLKPIRLETFDVNGTSLITVTFTEFNLNTNISDEIFNIPREI